MTVASPRSLRWLSAGSLAVLTLSGLLAVLACFRHFRAEVVGEAADNLPFRAAVTHIQIAPDGSPPLLTPDPEALHSGVIACRRLETVRYQPDVPAVGATVDPADFSEVENALAAAQTFSEKTAAELEKSRAGATATPDGSATNEKTAPEVAPIPKDTQRLDEKAASEASDLVTLRRAVALALYGPVIADLMQSGSAELDPIVTQHASLLLLTPLPGTRTVALPEEAAVTDRFGTVARARLLSIAFRLDPRLQTISGVYRTGDQPGHPRFIPGPAVAARLLTGPASSGVAAPASAVLQYNGRSWVYVEETPGKFRRREVSVALSLPNGSGWFQDHALQAGDNVVVAGGALLLGEER